MKAFEIGDIFESIESGLRGKIKAISFNSIHQVNEYVVNWDSDPSRDWSYPCEECDSAWRLVSRTFYLKSTQAIDFVPIKIDTSGPVKVQCNGHHSWIEVGFNFTKEVCRHCDQEKK